MNDCTRASIDTLFHSLSEVRASVRHLGDLLKKAQSQDYKGIVKRYTNIDITDDEVAMLVSVQKQIPQDYMKASDEQTLVGALSNILNRHNYIGFTSGMPNRGRCYIGLLPIPRGMYLWDLIPI